jgi:hypothetical protein
MGRWGRGCGERKGVGQGKREGSEVKWCTRVSYGFMLTQLCWKKNLYRDFKALLGSPLVANLLEGNLLVATHTVS